jgi:hypothetical protein
MENRMRNTKLCALSDRVLAAKDNDSYSHLRTRGRTSERKLNL